MTDAVRVVLTGDVADLVAAAIEPVAEGSAVRAA